MKYCIDNDLSTDEIEALMKKCTDLETEWFFTFFKIS